MEGGRWMEEGREGWIWRGREKDREYGITSGGRGEGWMKGGRCVEGGKEGGGRGIEGGREEGGR